MIKFAIAIISLCRLIIKECLKSGKSKRKQIFCVLFSEKKSQRKEPLFRRGAAEDNEDDRPL
jgi:hypothetical protein